MKPKTKNDICRSYLDKKTYESTPTLTLAKKIYSDHIETFSSIESVRTALRRLRGSTGKESRESSSHKSDVKKYGHKNPGNLNPFPPLPKPKKFFEDWGHFELTGVEKVLALYDIHVPFHDPEALETALQYGEDQEVDCILLAGDTADFYSVSFHEKNPKMRDFPSEIEAVRQFLQHLRGRFPNARIIYKWGNHEVRLHRYFSVKASELLGVDCFQFGHIFNLDELGIELIDDMRLVKYEDYVLCHGHEFFGNGGGAYPAKAYYAKAKTNIISGHLHRKSEYSEQDVFGNVKRAYSSACLCSRKQDYAQINFWDHGAVILTKVAEGKARVNSFLIENGEII